MNTEKQKNKNMDLNKKAKEIVENSPLFIEEEPTTVGSPENLIEGNEEEDEDE